ncbi:ATP-binding mismatch repair protein [Malassezia equina]|uniref:ATP-binding mismatch repair protein n=1 Tax=Malassezia equina TaxID=1381935 RepID=A0AAF0EER4_9BASI|nr:ATP-binding mismatch repair protein [Malassezia equina]
MADAPRIAPIAQSDVRRIAGAQVVPDMRSAVKELIENSLDAGATSIELRFKEYGLSGIEVVDNGSRRHHTSKLVHFDDLARVTTFGFRGEALASLCSVADVTMLTATDRDAPMGTLLEFAHDGSLKACDKRIARQRGTSVTISQLLSGLPVRRRELEKNVKREFAKAHAMIQAYALISEGVRWASSVLLADGKRVSQLVVRASTGPQYLQANITALFGSKAAAAMQPFNLDLSEEDDVHMVGLISKPVMGSGRSSGDRQYFYLNGRPWDSPKLAQIFNQVYRTLNATQYPCIVADLRMDRHAYDVNVSPDKRTLYLHDEAALLERIRVALEYMLEPTRGILRVQNQAFEPTPMPVEEAPKRRAPDATREPSKTARTEASVSTLSASWSSPPASQEPNASQAVTSMRTQFRQAVQNFARKRAQLPESYASEHEEEDVSDSDRASTELEPGPSSPMDPDELTQERPSDELEEEAPLSSPVPPRTSQEIRTVEPRKGASLSSDTVTLAFDLQAYEARMERAPRPCAPKVWQGAEVGVPDKDVVAALERVLAKTDFADMRVVGQFNLGFIIARRVTPDMDDLFIIDQHAADEKFNFETLQRTTKIHSQQLLRPERMELAPTDELVAMEHAEWLRMNGFDVKVDENAAPGHRVKLLSKPVSKDTVFDLHGWTTMDDGAEAWQATLQASESLEALQDALFSAEEVIQSHSHIWDSTDVSAARLLVRLDEVRDRLSQARDAAQKACMLPPTTDGPQRLSHAVTSIHSQFHKIHADALDLELKLESERAVLTTYDVCMQCERLLHNLESSSASESPSSKDAWEAKRRHMSSTCAHLLSTMRQSLPAQPKARARFAQIETRWDAIQPRNHVDDVQETTDMLASSLGISTPMSKRLANEEEDARKRPLAGRDRKRR